MFRWLSNEGEMSSAISFHNGTVFPCPARPCAHKFILWNNTLRKRHTRIHWLCNTTTENILSQIFWREDAHTHKNILFFLTDLKTVLFSRQMFTECANGETWGKSVSNPQCGSWIIGVIVLLNIIPETSPMRVEIFNYNPSLSLEYKVTYHSKARNVWRCWKIRGLSKHQYLQRAGFSLTDTCKTQGKG